MEGLKILYGVTADRFSAMIISAFIFILFDKN